MIYHRWRISEDDDDVDLFAFSVIDHNHVEHNGPECARCGFHFCHHCNPEGYGTHCPVEES